MIARCNDCGELFETSEEDACKPGTVCPCCYDHSPYCSYGHRSKEQCDCGPIADNE